MLLLLDRHPGQNAPDVATSPTGHLRDQPSTFWR
jgi:hypothetical protein